MDLGAKKRLELELMLAEQYRLARVAAGREQEVKFQNFLDRFIDNNSLFDRGLMPPSVNLLSSYEGCNYAAQS